MISDLRPDAPDTPDAAEHDLPAHKPRTSAEKVARNFIKKYGRTAFVRLLADLQTNESAVTTAARLGVCRERVRQWKDVLGVEVRLYHLHPEVQRLVNPPRLPSRAPRHPPHDGPPAALAEGLADADLDPAE